MAEPRGIPLRTEKRTPEQARQRLEQEILKLGGVRFDTTTDIVETGTATTPEPDAGERVSVQSGDTKRHSVAVLLQPETHIVGTDFNVQGGGRKARLAGLRGELMNSELPTGKLVVAQSTDQLFADQRYAMDLSDAPADLQAAVDRDWANLQRDSKAYHGDLPPELRVRARVLEPIMKLRLPDVPETEVAGGTVEEFPAGSKVPYDPAQMNRVPASDQVIFAAYRDKGWNKLGKRQREHYRELKARLEKPEANAA